MSTPETQPCLVCDEMTKNRCSSCVKAGIDLFFCSKEHQKLVWKAHKEVCGPPFASPFTPPDLTEAEVDALRTVIYAEGPLPARVPESIASKLAGRGKYTIARELELMSELEEGDMERVILPICRAVRAVTDEKLHRQFAGFGNMLRMQLFSGNRLPLAREAVRTADVFALAGQYSTILIGAIALSPHCNLANIDHDALSHRCLVLAALVKLKLDTIPPKSFDTEFITKSHQQLLEFLRPHLHFPGTNPWDGLATITSPLAAVLAPVHEIITTCGFESNGDIASLTCHSGMLPR
ncbi:hypothetical protein JCM10449v2_003584 [Rhodotorula kratochvilovae]